MKLLFVVSSLDLTQPFSATPGMVAVDEGLYEIGVEVIATPYQGPAIESLWWRAEPNPAKWQGDTFKAAPRCHRRHLLPTRGETPPLTNAPIETGKFAPSLNSGGVGWRRPYKMMNS